ncbi:hypothetical protein [Gemmatimonas sp.]
MPETAREYLIHRFRGDAHALRERVSALQSGARIPGPDLATSRQMAAACDEVADMLDAISPRDELSEEMAALGALLPLLEKKASVNATLPPVRAVFAGAATRIREVQAAEAQAQRSAPDAEGDDELEDDIDDALDDDIDDDDLVEDHQ